MQILTIIHLENEKFGLLMPNSFIVAQAIDEFRHQVFFIFTTLVYLVNFPSSLHLQLFAEESIRKKVIKRYERISCFLASTILVCLKVVHDGSPAF